MLKVLEKINIKNYNKSILSANNLYIFEKDNPYGHIREFNKLSKDIKIEAHRVISPLAVRLVGIEDIYSVTDINGNTYKFDIFEDGNYRISEVRKFKNIFKEDIDEKYSKKNN